MVQNWIYPAVSEIGTELGSPTEVSGYCSGGDALSEEELLEIYTADDEVAIHKSNPT